MPGIFSLYTENAREYIQHRLHKPHTIDRARFELILFEQLAKSDLETNYKIAWCHAFLNTTMFDHVWAPHTSTLNLDPDQITRYTANPDLFEYELPSSTSTTKPTTDPSPPSSPVLTSHSYASPSHRTSSPGPGVLKDYVPEVMAIQKRQEKEDGAFHPGGGIKDLDGGGKGKRKKAGARRGSRGGKGMGKVTGGAKGKGKRVEFSDPLEVEVGEPGDGGFGEELEVEVEVEMGGEIVDGRGDEAAGQLVFD